MPPRPGSASLIPRNPTKAGPHPIASHRHERRRVGGDPQEPEGPKWAIRPTAMARPGLSYVCGPSHQNLTNRREIVQRAGPAHRGRKPHSPRLEAKSGPRETTPDNVSDRPDRSHNPKVGGSNPPPATKGFSESSRKPTISWAFVLFQCMSTGLSTGLSGLFIGTYSTFAYAAYAGWRDASGPHAAPSRRRLGPEWRCMGQALCMPYAGALLNLWGLLATVSGVHRGDGSPGVSPESPAGSALMCRPQPAPRAHA